MLRRTCTETLPIILLLALSIPASPGCAGERRLSAGDGGGGTGDGGGGTGDAGTDGSTSWPDGSGPSSTCTKMDLIFVIDDSGSMSEEQTNLRANFPAFIDVLDAYRNETGDPLDYRIAVTTTGRPTETIVEIVGFGPMAFSEDGPNGAFLQPSGCGMSRPYITRSDPDVSGTFSCLANVGTSGSGVEMPLLMLERALTDRVSDGTNAGFLRPDALLGVVILSDEDDCARAEADDPVMITLDPSMPTASSDPCDPTDPVVMPTGRFLTALDTVTGGRARWAMAVIAGPGPGSCSSAFGSAIEAQRLLEFVGAAGTRTTFSSICEGDLAGGLMRALDTFEAACADFPLI